MKIIIDQNLLQLLYNYLLERPYKEVQGFCEAIRNLKPLEEPNVSEEIKVE